MGLPASWPGADQAPESESAPPPTPAAEWSLLDRSSQERTSHPQSAPCHRERGSLGWFDDGFMEGGELEKRDRKDGCRVKEDTFDDRIVKIKRGLEE